MSSDDKHFDHIAKMQSLGNLGKWWSWDSPIGLSIFFLTLTCIGYVIIWTVLQFIK